MELVNLGKPGEYLFEGIFDCIHELTTALAFARMSDSAYRVDTTSRLAQWRIDNLASCSYRKSDPFKIGKWNWFVNFLLLCSLVLVLVLLLFFNQFPMSYLLSFLFDILILNFGDKWDGERV